MRIFFFDTETTGKLPGRGERIAPPYIVEFGALIYDIEEGQEPKLVEQIHFLAKPPIPIPEEVSKIHGITDEHVKDSAPLRDSIGPVIAHMALADAIYSSLQKK